MAVIDRDAHVVVEGQPEPDEVHAKAALGPRQRAGIEEAGTGRDDIHLDAGGREPGMLTLAAALPAGQGYETCGVVLESDGDHEVEVVRLTPLEVDLQGEGVGADQDEGRVAPELRELAKRLDLLGKKLVMEKLRNRSRSSDAASLARSLPVRTSSV